MRSISLMFCILTVLAAPAFSQSIFDDPPAQQSPQKSPSPPVRDKTPNNQRVVPSAAEPASTGSATDTADQKKLPVPDSPALRNATALVNDAYENDITAATTPDQKKAMVQKLLDAAKDETGANRYALFTTAKDVAVDAGDLNGCDAALGDIEAAFDVDYLKLRSEAYAKIAPNLSLPTDRITLCKDISSTVRAAAAADRFDIAEANADLGLHTARTAGDPALARQATADVQTARDAKSAYADIKKALVILADKPSDPGATLTVGKYCCFVKGDWQKGLPMLALGSDPTLKALAAQELAGLTTADDKVKLADGWWNVADKLAGTAKNSGREHAAQWYREADGGLGNGLVRTKVEKRLAEVGEDRPLNMKPTLAGHQGKPEGAILWMRFDDEKLFAEEGSPVTVKDFSGNQSKGTLVGTNWKDARTGGGMVFVEHAEKGPDDQQSRIEVDRNAKGFPLDDFTISIWFVGSNDKVLIGSCQNELWFRGWYLTPKAFFWASVRGHRSGAVGRVVTQMNFDTKLGEWNHLCIVRSKRNVAVYQNGTLSAKSGEFPEAYLPIYSYGLTIGNAKCDNGRHAHWMPFAGTIDEVIVWGRSVSATEISDVYAAGVQRHHLR